MDTKFLTHIYKCEVQANTKIYCHHPHTPTHTLHTKTKHPSLALWMLKHSSEYKGSGIAGLNNPVQLNNLLVYWSQNKQPNNQPRPPLLRLSWTCSQSLKHHNRNTITKVASNPASQRKVVWSKRWYNDIRGVQFEDLMNPLLTAGTVIKLVIITHLICLLTIIYTYSNYTNRTHKHPRSKLQMYICTS